MPGGRLPQHLRVLGGPRGHVPHRRRPVHPALRLLPDRHRQARAARPRRAAPGRRVGAEDGAALRHHHRRRPRRPARRRRLAVRRDGARDPRAQPRHRRREPDPRLQRQARPAPRGLRVPARGARPQRRDGAADLQADPAGVPLRPLARRAHRGPRLRPGHQVQPDPRHGRDPRGGQPGAARPARRRLRAGHDHPVPPPVACGTTRSSAGSSPRSSSSSRTRPTRSASPGVMSGPLVRSSYRAGRLYRQAMEARATAVPPPDPLDSQKARPHPPCPRTARRPGQDEPAPAVRRHLQDGQAEPTAARPVAARLVPGRRGRRLRRCSGCFRRQRARSSWSSPSSAALLLGLLAAVVVFGRRAQKSAYGQMEGQPGAAGQRAPDAAPRLEDRPDVAFTKQQDVVHRVVGPPGHRAGRRGQPQPAARRC